MTFEKSKMSWAGVTTFSSSKVVAELDAAFGTAAPKPAVSHRGGRTVISVCGVLPEERVALGLRPASPPPTSGNRPPGVTALSEPRVVAALDREFGTAPLKSQVSHAGARTVISVVGGGRKGSPF